MQDWKDNELLKTRMLESETEQPKFADGATHRVVGKFPKTKHEIKINGLVFIVTYSDYATGLIHAKIKRGIS